MKKRWCYPSESIVSEAIRLSQSLPISTNILQLLCRRGWNTAESIQSFLTPSLGSLHDPYLLKGMPEAVELLLDAILQKRRIVILGDYDVDGVTATAMMLDFLSACGCQNIDFFIPNRFEHGYGLTHASAEVLLKMKPDVVVTVDNGITAIDEVQVLQKHGITVLITDHHLAQSSRVPDCIVVNPSQPECPYPFKGISGCGVALKVVMAVRSRLREQGFWSSLRPEPNLKALFDLAALGTIADVVPLIDENRLLVFHGLQVLNAQPRIGIIALKQLKKINEITTQAVGFQIAPLLNAAGRMKEADLGVRLLLARYSSDAQALAKQLHQANEERRATEQQMTEIALEQANRQQQKPCVIVHSPSFHEGVSGIVASRLVDRFYKPALVLVERNQDYKGSGRSIPEVHLKEALSQCEMHLGRYGGHAAAAGFLVKKQQLESFISQFEQACHQQTPTPPQPELAVEGKLGLDDITFDFIDELQQLQPFGAHHPDPLFVIDHPTHPPFRMKEKHLKWNLNSDLEIVGWNLAEIFEKNTPRQLAVSLGLNEFGGNQKIQLVIKDYQ